ncbi:efflux RND transporter periplasmic adaptor subunit [Jeongeupia naejangsanensis]|uniref:HlyD family efflux transporter periplasmic adaptor subunit n=1 Tax=Jeongeupia naejangsanensis TaxID=613195 RepID=A0ABS2BMJ6_9NEIS|nr:HlyD family efflux transporter periplasmic adaptor subunit [Jeongeupia naejangsanensis]MBM3116852.1 HlyD family efflux transporter periplasmic adaptor subunit [Jeongeupia naejangsanensis]
MNESLPHPQLLLSLDAVRDRALAAPSLDALAFSMANDLYPFLQFYQAVVFAEHEGGRLELLAVSGLAKPSEDSPYLVWLIRAGRFLATQLNGDAPVWLARDRLALDDDLAEGWQEWWPAGAWVLPVLDRDGHRLGLLCVLLDEAPPEAFPGLLTGVRLTWSYCWAALSKRRRRFRLRLSKRQYTIGAVVLAVIMALPVPLTVLAPAEVVSREAQVISSPVDGVVERMLVRPNQQVEAGTPLFALEETTLRNRVSVLEKQVAVADAELMAASQRAFDNAQSKGELAELGGVAQQRRAELAAATAQLTRSQVKSPKAGVAVFSDVNDWLGKPVVTGERILSVADPGRPAMRIELPVADAIALEPGAEVTLYLTAYPLTPLHGKVLETSYQAKPSESGVVAYPLLASIDGAPAHARLGLHGTAKLYGQRVTLAYYLLRRPLAAVRAWTGW